MEGLLICKGFFLLCLILDFFYFMEKIEIIVHLGEIIPIFGEILVHLREIMAIFREIMIHFGENMVICHSFRSDTSPKCRDERELPFIGTKKMSRKHVLAVF